MNTLTDGSREDTRNSVIDFMLLILVIILSILFAHCGTHNLAIDLAPVRHIYLMQPPPSVPPIVEGVVV